MKHHGWLRRVAVLLPFIAVLAGACAGRPLADPTAEKPGEAGQASPATAPLRPANDLIQEAYGRLPLTFEENRGHIGGGVRYMSRTRGGAVALTRDELLMGTREYAVRLAWQGARPARIAGERMLDGRVNYLVGQDRSRWRT